MSQVTQANTDRGKRSAAELDPQQFTRLLWDPEELGQSRSLGVGAETGSLFLRERNDKNYLVGKGEGEKKGVCNTVWEVKPSGNAQ